jgi:glycosyltransferase involved in cell wall biosynthesis
LRFDWKGVSPEKGISSKGIYLVENPREQRNRSGMARNCGRKVLIIVENLTLPFDRRVWQEATTLKSAGYEVAAICPKDQGYEAEYECIDGIHIYRHPLPLEGSGAWGYLAEYITALFWEFYLSFKILKRHGFDVVQACNPPDLIFVVGLFYKWFLGKSFVFDHHDINPELYLAKFGKKDIVYRLMILCERLTFKSADWSIATNESYRAVALERGGMDPGRVTVVRSGPSLARLKKVPPDEKWKKGRKHLVGYVGVMGKQEGIDHLLEAAKILVHEQGRNDIQFVLVGGGTELPAMQKLCDRLGLNDQVTFTGRVADEILLQALSTADVCVNSDVANEMNDKSTMNKVMEYMALGKPIVQYDLAEGRFSAMDASLYARPNDIRDLADKIGLLLDDTEKREAMGAFGERRVQNDLHWGVESPKFLSAYDQVFRERARRSSGRRVASEIK